MQPTKEDVIELWLKGFCIIQIETKLNCKLIFATNSISTLHSDIMYGAFEIFDKN